MSNAILQAALAYARAGIPVFPCKPADKRPYTQHGFKDATTDEAQVIAWWTQWPAAMIGVPMGKTSGLWALDVDVPKREGDDNGYDSLQKLMAENGEPPITWMQQTPNGGLHLIYYYPQDGEGIPNSASKIAPKIDVRGDGGYIIIAPSINGEGKAYSVFNQVPFVHASEWLVKLARKSLEVPLKLSAPSAVAVSPEIQAGIFIVHPYAQKALDEECAAIAAASEGTRNDKLNKAAFAVGTLVGSGALDEGLARYRLMDAALKCGLSVNEAAKTIDSGLLSGKQKPRSIPDAPSTTSQVSEESIASAFSTRYQDTLRFCKDWGYWLEWIPQKHTWEQDKTNRAFDYARRECKILNPDNKPSLGKSTTAQGVERFARADSRHATTEDQWDQQLFMLGTPSGVINLKTGDFYA